MAGGAAAARCLLRARSAAPLPLTIPPSTMRLTLVHVSALLPRCAQIGILANKGISATDIKKLRDAGLHTVADIQHTTTKKMLNIKGLSEAKVQKIKDVAKNESGNTFMSGSELRQKRESILKARRARARCCLLLPAAAAACCRCRLPPLLLLLQPLQRADTTHACSLPGCRSARAPQT
jgi:hypothetical protein